MGRMINSAGHLLLLVFLRFALLPYLSYRGFPPNLAYYARWQLGTLLYVNLGQTRPYSSILPDSAKQDPSRQK